MEDWDEIRKWRRSTRAALISRRLAVPRADRPRLRSVMRDQIREHFRELDHACIGFYWPFKAEIDLRHLVREFLPVGAQAALPVVVEKQRPLEFWAWRPRMKLARGIWNIPVPAERHVVRPTALLVPLLGFDAAGYRLGYGGGYYDRTLATFDPKPLTIGVGYELGRLKTIYPQPHDIPLDAIVTEAGCARFRDRGAPLDGSGQAKELTYASPPCFMHELDPSYLGYWSREDILALLNRLLEAERAGARGVGAMSKEGSDKESRAALHAIAKDEARFCAMLTRHIARLGGTPSVETGAFYEKLLAVETSDARIDLLNRGQGWVVRKLQEALPRIGDDALQRDLRNMLDIHERNMQRCTEMA